MNRMRAWVPVLVMALAVWLRLHALGRWSLDGDEYYCWADVTVMLEGQPWPEGARSHPLGYLGMLALAAVGGSGEGVLRAFSALCGTGAVACLLWMRRDVLQAPVAWCAAVLAALSPWLIYHAQTARFYGPLLLFAALATLWSLPGPGRRPWRAAAAFLGSVLCHPSALLLGPCLLTPLFLPSVDWGRLGRIALRGALVVVLALVVARAHTLALIERALLTPSPTHYDPLHFVQGLGYNVGPATGLLVLVGLWAARGREALAWTLAVCTAVPSLVLLAGGLGGVSMHQRYAMASMPALLLLAGLGWERLRQGRPRLAALALGAAVLAPLPALGAYMQDGDRHDYRGAAQWLSERISSEDLLVVEEHALLEHYLHRQQGFEQMVLHEAPLSGKKRHSFVRNRYDCWLVLKASRLKGVYGAPFDDWVARHFTEVIRLGSAPPVLVRHDNRLVVFHRTQRISGP